MTEQGDEIYLTPEEAASFIGKSRQTVDRYAKKGKLTALYKGERVYYSRREIEALNTQLNTITSKRAH